MYQGNEDPPDGEDANEDELRDILRYWKNTFVSRSLSRIPLTPVTR